MLGISKHAFLEQGAFLHNDSKHLAVSHDHFKAQSLRSSMDQLHKELERMKNDNSLLLPLDDHYFDPNFQGLQTELMQLHKVNEELRNIFPVFNELGSGNALERVLALEIELAEALRAKKKSSIIFQRNQMNVLEVNKTDCENCISDHPLHNWTTGAGRDVVPLNVTRKYYFISGKGFCYGGMKFVNFFSSLFYLNISM